MYSAIITVAICVSDLKGYLESNRYTSSDAIPNSITSAMQRANEHDDTSLSVG